jgi:nucleotide-binding universal stress UspA family protein
MSDSILPPVDGSEQAAKIVHHAAELAQLTGPIEVLCVADTTLDSATVVDGTVVDALEQERETIVADVTETLEALDVEHSTDVVQGSPASTIVDYAERYDRDLIVLPTHGRTGISRYLLGSVTEKVVRLSNVSVLTARMQPDEQLAFPYESILIPTDGSPASTAAAKHGLALAATLDAPVHILSVEEVTTKANEHDLAHVQTYVEHESPAEVIRKHIETNGVHAVVMGA